MTEHARELSDRSRRALPQNRFELAAWLMQKGGLGMIFLALLAAVWWSAEKRVDQFRLVGEANVKAFQQCASEIQAQRHLSIESNARMRECVSEIMAELRAIRLRESTTSTK